MSTPGEFSTKGTLAHRAKVELIAAMSSLNMYPEPVSGYTFDSYSENDGRYLSDIDANVAHAMEHLAEAFRILQKED